jgi:hypothetical protein
MVVLHSTIVDGKLHVIGFIQDPDPGAVGAGMAWVDTSSGAGLWKLKIRNQADTGWELICSNLLSNTTVVAVNYYEVLPTDSHILVTVADDAEVVLPSATTYDGRVVHIKRTSSNVYDVEISVVGGGGLVEGAASYILKHQYEAVTCVAIDGGWWIY